MITRRVRHFRPLWLLALLAFSYSLPGCGSGGAGGGGGGNQTIAITVTPSPTNLAPLGTLTFTAAVVNSANTNVTWSVQEGTTGGSITMAGAYTAPASTGTYHVMAVSQADPSKSAIATVNVVNTLSLTPSTATPTFNQTQQFTAKFNGADTTAVTWSVRAQGAGGTITSTGLYTAPAFYHTPPSGITQHTDIVTATSITDPTKTATVVVSVQAGNGVVIIQ